MVSVKCVRQVSSLDTSWQRRLPVVTSRLVLLVIVLVLRKTVRPTGFLGSLLQT